MSKKDETTLSDKDSKAKSIYVKVSDETRAAIDKHKDVAKLTISQIIEDAIKLYDEYKSMPADSKAIVANLKKDHGGTAMKLIEKALQAFAKSEANKPETKDLWLQARDEMNMMLIGRTTFDQLIAAAAAPEERLDKPQKKNVGFDIILWYTEKPIKHLNLEEMLEAIKVIWTMANWFYKIDVIKQNNDEYHVIFKHHQNRRYSEYWGKYFQELLTSDELSFKVLIETQEFEETISLIIKMAFKK